MKARDRALIALGHELQSKNYRFVAITPTSHQRVLLRKTESGTLQSVFGWNSPFERNLLDQRIFALLDTAKELKTLDGRFRSKVRLRDYRRFIVYPFGLPTVSRDAVFFGPDMYRFARALRSALADMTVAEGFTLLDIGCGSGAEGLFAATELLLSRAMKRRSGSAGSMPR